MYNKSPITERVQYTRERYYNTQPRICLARYKLMTEFYMKNPHLTGILKRAECFKYMCENIVLRVDEGDVIVGALTAMLRGAAPYPEYNIAWLLDEVRTDLIQTRDADPYLISDEDKDYLLSTGDFWLTECQSAKLEPYLPPLWLDKYESNGMNMFGKNTYTAAPVGHFCPSYDRAINVGFGAIKAEADAKIAKYDEEGIYGDSIDRYNFYRAVSTVCDGMITFTKRYARLVAELADSERDETRKKELLEMADTLDWVMEKPCRNFHDAIQVIYLYQICMTLDGCMHAISFGRLDVYLRKFYEAGISGGTLTHERAQELIDLFFLKVAEMNRLWAYGATKSTGGYTTNQLITLGGVDKAGVDVTNPVTFMVLASAARLMLHTPPLAMRIHSGTPDELWTAAIDTNKVIGGIPTFENDDLIIPAMMSRGLSLESARNYILIGCVEPGGCGDEWPACGGTGVSTYISLAGALMLGLNDGYYTMTSMYGVKPRDERVGRATGRLCDMTTFEEVLEAYKKQVEFAVKWQASCINAFEYVARQNMPLPVVSATMEGCMESGRDVMFGGAKYNSTGIAGVGIGNVADSLNMINHLCFETKRCTTKELYDALIANWEGYEDLHSYIVNEAPHFGNGDDTADRYACWASDVFADAVNACTGPRGRYSAGLYPVTTHVILGSVTMATPDGRRAGDALADGISPVQQMDKNGPTAVLMSVKNIDQTKYPNGTLLNMKFHPSSLSGEDGITKLKQMIQTYFDMGGMEMQLNFVSAEMLREAKEDPEAHKNLIVRVAGFSAYFVELHDECQVDLINRTELMI